MTFGNVLARQSFSFCNRALQAFALRDMKMAARKDCRVDQKMSYRFSFCEINGACTRCRRRSIYFVSIAKLNDRCFCYFTAAMFVPLRRAQTWRFHTKLYKFEWHTSVNNGRMKNSRNLTLGEVVYIAIIYHIPDSWIYLLNGYYF